MTIHELAEFMYNAYLEITGGVSAVTGDKLPPYEYTSESVKRAWVHVASRTLNKINSGC